MKRTTLLLLLASFLGAHWTAVQNSRAISTVLSFEKRWNEIYRQSDIRGMDSLLDDDFIITVEDGSTFSKLGYIAHNGNSKIHVKISEMYDLKVRMHGNTAVVTGAYHEKSTENSKEYEYYDRLTDVWMYSDGRWRLIASHYSAGSPK